MSDCFPTMGGDLSVGVGGDVLLASGSTYTQQRVTRRLLTNPGGYIWQLDYGAGLPAMVGQVASLDSIGAIVRAQMALEAAVAPSPEPTVTLASNALGQTAAVISYTDADSGQTVTV